MDAQVATVQFGADGGEQVRAIRTPDKDLGAAARCLRAQQDHGLTEIVFKQVTSVPRQLVRRVANKVVGAAAVPDLVQRFFIDVIHAQQRQRLHLVMTHAFTHIRRVLHPTTQLFFSGEIQFAQQALFPAVPQGFVGRANIGDRQAYQEAQTVFGLHLFGELLDDFRILNIAALGGDRHQQMLAYQPGDQLGFTRIQTMQFGEFQHVLSTED